jgi:hypothetical protein
LVFPGAATQRAAAIRKSATTFLIQISLSWKMGGKSSYLCRRKSLIGLGDCGVSNSSRAAYLDTPTRCEGANQGCKWNSCEWIIRTKQSDRRTMSARLLRSRTKEVADAGDESCNAATPNQASFDLELYLLRDIPAQGPTANGLTIYAELPIPIREPQGETWRVRVWTTLDYQKAVRPS